MEVVRDLSRFECVARDFVNSEMVYRKEGVFMGGEKVMIRQHVDEQKNTQELEFKWKQTSESVVKEFVSNISDLSFVCLQNV